MIKVILFPAEIAAVYGAGVNYTCGTAFTFARE